LRTNGGFTTFAASDLSRTRTFTSAPGAVPRGSRASAIDRASVGEKVPLVISPSLPPASAFWWARRTPPDSLADSWDAP